MEIKKYRYNSLQVIALGILGYGSLIALIVLMFFTNRIAGYIFLALIQILALFAFIPMLTMIKGIFGKLHPVVLVDGKIILQVINLEINIVDVENIYLHSTRENTHIVLKLYNFDSYRSLLKKTLIGRITLLNFRTFGKSKVFINLRFIKDNKTLLRDLKNHVHTIQS